ncbi:MAG TPA: hypothetical protein PLJ62_10940, partial [Thermoflexales bacterium]|nr:hypothetical protein [Thermoflexales bacterium]
MSTTPLTSRRIGTAVLVALIASVALVGARPADAGPADRDSRIIGGTQAAPKAWPSQVALLDNRKPGAPSKAYSC